MEIFIIVIITIILFFGTKGIVFYFTDINRPVFLQYKPFCCYECFSFWSLMTEYITLGIAFNYLFFIGILFTILDVIAQEIDKKERTI